MPEWRMRSENFAKNGPKLSRVAKISTLIGNQGQ